jgi:glucosamine--fructose-6-phosphate aminotransferase (isomerizing)
MCGIVGYVGSRPAVEILLKGLKRLEYRGYDSAGIAYFDGNRIETRKSQGKIENVEKLLSDALSASITTGIGHTRWATHGKPTTQNAHPHRTGHVVLVHNGIIENYQEIKRELIERGHKPQSETDSELFGFLVLEEMEKGLSLFEAVRRGFSRLEGGCSVVVMSEREPGTVIGVRNGSPLVAGLDPSGGAVLASDAQPLLDLTREVVFLEHGDIVVASRKGIEFFSLETGKRVDRAASKLDWSVEKLDKGGYPHYMLKEIYEQPTALIDTLNAVLDRAHADPFPLAAQPGATLLEKAQEITFVACGSSWHAASVGKYWLERWAKVPTQVELASEFRYRQPVLRQGSLLVAISQSGETADTLAVIRQAKGLGLNTLAITNVRGSTLSREADAVIYTAAGPEIGVAATKTFSTQMQVILAMAGYLGLKRQARGQKELTHLFDQMIKLPHLIAEQLAERETIQEIARKLMALKGFFFIGRGYSYPIALEGALKLKEIAYLHAEGYAAGELKHGPIAMIDEKMAVVVLAPKDTWRDKTLSNLEEVKARGAVIVAIGDPTDRQLQKVCDHWIPLPAASGELDESLLPFFLVPAIQLLSYELAVLKGADVDKPRNLAKSVTVE